MLEEQEITQLLANQPIELKPETDFFNSIPKAQTILRFIESFSESLEKNKLLALYGDWGSGKTSLLKYIQGKLNESKFKTIYFETWKYEKDDNLALSLVDVILENVDKEKFSEAIQNFKNISFSLLKNFAKSISFQTPIITINTGEIIKSLEDEAIKEEEDKSFHQKMKEFESSYKIIEDKLLKRNDKQIIIFIDDLDRCEPENILNLLTALKHFFSNGEKTIFFCGIDKDAITKAVKHKYKDVVKSEEYLEKIFDINFHMPLQFDLKKLLNYYFLPGHVGIIEKYLKSINFTNPRHLKKVLNKFLILKFIKNKGIDFEELIPEMINGNILNLIFVLHFIILFEFKKVIFLELKDIDKRMQQLTFNKYNGMIQSGDNPASLSHLRVNSRDFEPSKNEIMDIFGNTHMSKILKALHLILTIPPKTINAGISGDLNPNTQKEYLEYLDNFTGDENIQVNFAKFIIQHQEELKTQGNTFKYNNLFKMVEEYL